MTVVLVHGAWSTGDVWDEVRHHLGGDDVLAPTLRGCGRGGDPSTTLDEVVDDLVDLLAPLDDVTLVGHSWSGLVTWLAAARSDAVRRLALVGGFEPTVGEALVDAFGDEQREDEVAAIEAAGGWWPPPTAHELAGDPTLAPGTVELLAATLLPHPGRTVTDPVRGDLDLGDVDVVRLEDATTGLDPGHWPMVTAPGALAAWLHDVHATGRSG